MMKQTLRTLEFVFFASLLNMNYAEEFKNVASFKEDVKKSEGSDDITLLDATVKPEDLTKFQVNRDLENLTLKGNSVYLLNLIVPKKKYGPITKLCLESYIENDELNKIREENNSSCMASLRVVEEIEALGFVAIRQVIFGVNLYVNHPVKTLKFFTDKEISYKDSETITNNPNLNQIYLYNKTLQIEGPVPIRIVKFFNVSKWTSTESISIKCDLNQVGAIKYKAGSSISIDTFLKKLILEEGAFLLACDDKFELFSDSIDTLVLKCEKFPKDKLTKDQEINLMACKNLELHGFAIVILPLISSSSLKNIEEIGTIYENDNIKLSSILSESNKCNKILQNNISDKLEKHEIRLKKDFPKSDPSERLKKIFGDPPTKAEDSDKKLYLGLPIGRLIGIIAGVSILLGVVIFLLVRKSRDGKVPTRYQ